MCVCSCIFVYFTLLSALVVVLVVAVLVANTCFVAVLAKLTLAILIKFLDISVLATT